MSSEPVLLLSRQPVYISEPVSQASSHGTLTEDSSESQSPPHRRLSQHAPGLHTRDPHLSRHTPSRRQTLTRRTHMLLTEDSSQSSSLAKSDSQVLFTDSSYIDSHTHPAYRLTHAGPSHSQTIAHTHTHSQTHSQTLTRKSTLLSLTNLTHSQSQKALSSSNTVLHHQTLYHHTLPHSLSHRYTRAFTHSLTPS
jgi:hypothetical protein